MIQLLEKIEANLNCQQNGDNMVNHVTHPPSEDLYYNGYPNKHRLYDIKPPIRIPSFVDSQKAKQSMLRHFEFMNDPANLNVAIHSIIGSKKESIKYGQMNDFVQYSKDNKIKIRRFTVDKQKTIRLLELCKNTIANSQAV